MVELLRVRGLVSSLFKMYVEHMSDVSGVLGHFLKVRG
jgi:hypothetical protein